MVNPTRLFDFPYYQLDKYNLDFAFATKYDGEWIKVSTKEYIKQANEVSRGGLKLRLNKNDKVALISSNNRTEWNVCDIGLMQIGVQTVPIYPTISAEDYEYILNHSEAKYVLVSDVEVYEKVKAIQANVPSLKGVYSFDKIDGCANWSEIKDLGKDESNQNEVEALMESVSPNDLATIIYTSGTTGRPKGVMLSHNNIVSDVLSSAPRVPLRPGESVALSFLPVCHIF